MAEEKRYKTEPFKCWQEAKQLRLKFYNDYTRAHEVGGIRVAGSGASFFALPIGLGWDVQFLTGETYGASVSSRPEFSLECMEEVERRGYARDICSYMRNYWGSAMLNKFIHADGRVEDGFPKPDLIFSVHICCGHANWYRHVNEIEGGDIPMYFYDLPCMTLAEGTVNKRRVDYVTAQMLEAIPWMEKITGRTWDLEKFVEAAQNESETSKLWAEICMLQKAIPAPMEEKTAYSFQGLTALRAQSKECVDFMRVLLDEIKDRVERGIAASEHERFRVITDSNPPWSGLELFRYMDRNYGVISLGSIYTFGLHAAWEYDENGMLVPVKSLRELGVPMRTREEAVRAYTEFKLKFLQLFFLLDPIAKSQIMVKMAKQWNADAAIIHLNRGCEGSALGQKENRLALIEAGIPVMTYEGNVGDDRDFDLARTKEKMDSFFEGQGLRKLTK